MRPQLPQLDDELQINTNRQFQPFLPTIYRRNTRHKTTFNYITSNSILLVFGICVIAVLSLCER